MYPTTNTYLYITHNYVVCTRISTIIPYYRSIFVGRGDILADICKCERTFGNQSVSYVRLDDYSAFGISSADFLLAYAKRT